MKYLTKFDMVLGNFTHNNDNMGKISTPFTSFLPDLLNGFQCVIQHRHDLKLVCHLTEVSETKCDYKGLDSSLNGVSYF